MRGWKQNGCCGVVIYGIWLECCTFLRNKTETNMAAGGLSSIHMQIQKSPNLTECIRNGFLVPQKPHQRAGTNLSPGRWLLQSVFSPLDDAKTFTLDIYAIFVLKQLIICMIIFGLSAWRRPAFLCCAGWMRLGCFSCVQWIPSDRAVSLSDSSRICRETVGARSGLSGQVAQHTERSCAITMDRLACGCLQLTVTYEQKDNFLPFSLSLYIDSSLVLGLMPPTL